MLRTRNKKASSNLYLGVTSLNDYEIVKKSLKATVFRMPGKTVVLRQLPDLERLLLEKLNLLFQINP